MSQQINELKTRLTKEACSGDLVGSTSEDILAMLGAYDALEAENARLRDALVAFLDPLMINDTYPAEFWEMYAAATKVARAALKGNE